MNLPSTIPVNGYIYIYIPIQLGLRHEDLTDSDVFSGGICLVTGFNCINLVKGVQVYNEDYLPKNGLSACLAGG